MQGLGKRREAVLTWVTIPNALCLGVKTCFELPGVSARTETSKRSRIRHLQLSLLPILFLSSSWHPRYKPLSLLTIYLQAYIDLHRHSLPKCLLHYWGRYISACRTCQALGDDDFFMDAPSAALSVWLVTYFSWRISFCWLNDSQIQEVFFEKAVWSLLMLILMQTRISIRIALLIFMFSYGIATPPLCKFR